MCDLTRVDVAYPPWNSHINWIPDPVPSPSRDHGDLTSPSPSRDHGIQTHGKENLLPQDAPRKFPRKLRPRRRKEKQSGPAANHNSLSRETGSQPGTSGSPGSVMRAPVKHPLTFQRSQHPQHSRLTANHNSEHRFDPDHPESGRLYIPARSSIQQDSALRSRRGSFSGSPSGLTRNVSMTDSVREGRIAGGLRPGPVQPHPRVACPDTRLDIDAAPPEAAAVSRAEQSPSVLDIPESGRLETTRCPESPQRRIAAAQMSTQTAQESLFSAIPAQEAPIAPRTLV